MVLLRATTVAPTRGRHARQPARRGGAARATAASDATGANRVARSTSSHTRRAASWSTPSSRPIGPTTRRCRHSARSSPSRHRTKARRSRPRASRSAGGVVCEDALDALGGSPCPRSHRRTGESVRQQSERSDFSGSRGAAPWHPRALRRHVDRRDRRRGGARHQHLVAWRRRDRRLRDALSEHQAVLRDADGPTGTIRAALEGRGATLRQHHHRAAKCSRTGGRSSRVGPGARRHSVSGANGRPTDDQAPYRVELADRRSRPGDFGFARPAPPLPQLPSRHTVSRHLVHADHFGPFAIAADGEGSIVTTEPRRRRLGPRSRRSHRVWQIAITTNPPRHRRSTATSSSSAARAAYGDRACAPAHHQGPSIERDRDLDVVAADGTAVVRTLAGHVEVLDQ